MAKRGENIYHRKDGRWEGRYISGRHPNGKAILTSVYGSRYQDVRRKLIEKKSACLIQLAKGQAIYFEDRVDYYLEKKIRPFVKPSTYMHYHQIAAHYLIPAFGTLQLSDITSERIQCYFSGMAERLSPGTTRNIFNLLRAILRDAFLDGHLSRQIWENVRLPSAQRGQAQVLTLEEQKRFEEIALRENRIEFILCLYTGIRVGELCALQWRDVDIQSTSLRICKSLRRIGKQSVIGAPKTDCSSRIIPLPPFLFQLLDEYRKACGGREDEFLFPGKKRAYCDIRTIQARFAKLAGLSGLQHAHVHTLRHTYATRLLEQGVGVETVGALLGHASPSITLHYYAHCTTQHKVESVRILHLLNS